MSDTKEHAEPSLRTQREQRRVRSEQPSPWDANDAFVLAFADALRDILREERHGVA
jgi:hypothetical protein